MEWIKRYWLEAAFAAIVSGLGFAVRSLWMRAKRERDEQKMIKAGLLAILHDRLFAECRRLIRAGRCTVEELRNIEFLYSAYHDLGGNGTGTELYNRCRALPIADGERA